MIAVVIVLRVGLNAEQQVDEMVYRNVGEILNGIHGIILVVNSEEL